MSRESFFFAEGLLLALLLCAGTPSAVPGGVASLSDGEVDSRESSGTAADPAAASVRIGADLSFIPQLRSLGATYSDGGKPVDVLDVLKDRRFEIARLRLWHSPDEPWHGLDSTVAFARELSTRGYDLFLDLHYSDSWADPGKQIKPSAWAHVAPPALVDSVRNYTEFAVSAFLDQGVALRYVQLGNEIDGGFLWDTGKVGWPASSWDTPENWNQFAALLRAAMEGIDLAYEGREMTHRPRIVLHVSSGGDNEKSRRFIDHLVERDVRFDVLGVSFYPWWHGGLGELARNLRDLSLEYEREIMIVETAFPWTVDGFDDTENFVTGATSLPDSYPVTPQGQQSFLRDVLSVLEHLPGGRGHAMLYWEPTWTAVPGGPDNPYENLALFDNAGASLPALDWKQSGPREPSRTVQVTGDFNEWSAVAPAMTRIGPGMWGDTLAVRAGCHLLKFRTDHRWDVPFDFGGCEGEDDGCDIELDGAVCPTAGKGGALGRIEFAEDGLYEFVLDEVHWTYRIRRVP